MKQINVTAPVMEKIIGKEKIRVRSWVRGFLLFSATAVSGMALVGFLVISDLQRKRTFDMFELLHEDPEIIREFWTDAVSVFWEEMPRNLLLVGTIMACICIVVLVLSAKKRKIIRTKMAKLEKYP